MEKYKVSKFYTAPTAIRALMKFGEDFSTKYDMSKLKVLGTVGEPINPEAWHCKFMFLTFKTILFYHSRLFLGRFMLAIDDRR